MSECDETAEIVFPQNAKLDSSFSDPSLGHSASCDSEALLASKTPSVTSKLLPGPNFSKRRYNLANEIETDTIKTITNVVIPESPENVNNNSTVTSINTLDNEIIIESSIDFKDNISQNLEFINNHNDNQNIYLNQLFEIILSENSQKSQKNDNIKLNALIKVLEKMNIINNKNLLTFLNDIFAKEELIDCDLFTNKLLKHNDTNDFKMLFKRISHFMDNQYIRIPAITNHSCKFLLIQHVLLCFCYIHDDFIKKIY